MSAKRRHAVYADRSAPLEKKQNMNEIGKIKSLIGENRLKECFAELETYLFKNNRFDLENELLLIKSSYNSVRKKNNLNLAEPNLLNIEENKIKFALIELLDSMQEIREPQVQKPKETLQNKSINNIKKLRIELISLEERLKALDFKGADLITTNLFILNQNSDITDACLNKITILEFPFQIFHKMDSLWQQYSNSQYGFSLQRDIWHSINGGSQIIGVKSLNKFADYVGWQINGEWIKSYNDFNFGLNANIGHLPTMRQSHLDGSSSWWIAWRDNVSAVLQISNKLP